MIDALLADGTRIAPTKGPATEHSGVLLELCNPRARLSRTETRGRPFSCLGELCWYLSGRDDADFITYYLSAYRQFADGDHVFGAYGPRLFNEDEQNQFLNVVRRLRDHPHSRRAVIQLFRASDVSVDANNIPCTSTLQFLCRDDKLDLITNMRSNDVFLGLPHDVFAFTMFQEIIARSLSIELGTYKHVVGSLHLYDADRDSAKRFLQEGWQSTTLPMPAMPTGDPWPAIHAILDVEAAFREARPPSSVSLDRLEAYWADLAYLLAFFRAYKDKDVDRAGALREQVTSQVYWSFLEQKLHLLRGG
ncbi:MAG: thymidylate synthase [bacterium]|nr:thymidylate synthase [bacterium]MDE0235349.1 thymidylate synthase [bacterium]